MLRFRGRGILLDIEGTTSSIRFVYDVMFPFARRELDRYLSEHWGAADLNDACARIAEGQGRPLVDVWTGKETDEQKRQAIQAEVIRLMDADAKTTGLKQLQGLIWRAGFESGEMQAHVYDDVPEAIRSWNKAGCDIRIYSSGSIAAQKLFFGHTVAGDLRSLFQGHYDTTTGPKKEAGSYRQIVDEFGLPANEILFLSDVVEELDAAREAGLVTALCRRPGNAEVVDLSGHPVVNDFRDIDLER